MFKNISYIILLIFSAIGIYLRLEAFDVVYINNWITSDFDRAFKLVDGEYIPLAGPDMSNGRRLPGPFLYFLLAIPILINHSYESIFTFNLISNIASIIGFYWVVNRFFGFKVALVCILLLLVNIPHIGAAGFPKNAAFIFPLVPIFLYLIFEFSINRKTKLLPWITLVVSLGFQISYSFATFYLVPLIVCWALRQKIPFKTLVLSTLVALICFTPYFMYKQKTFITNQEGIRIVRGLEEYPIWGLLRVPIIDHTIERITFRNGVKRYQLLPKDVASFYYVFTTVSLWSLFLYVVIKTRKEGEARKYSREIVVLVLFYVPALIFEIVAPRPNHPNPHPWYSWIFIMPQLLMISLALNVFIGNCYKKLMKVGLVAIASLVLVLITTRAFGDMEKLNENLKSEIFSHWTYQNTRLFYQTLMNEVKVTPKQLMSNFYFDDIPPFSKVFLNDFYDTLKSSDKKEIEQNLNNDCTLIIDPASVQDGNFPGHRFFMFQNDISIIVNRPSDIFIPVSGKLFQLASFKYKPVLKQSCYSNLFSRFAVDEISRNLLKQSKSLDTTARVDFKKIFLNENYDSQSQLLSFESKLILYSRFLGSPIKVNFLFFKKRNSYLIKTTVQQNIYYPYRKILKSLKFLICNKKAKPTKCQKISAISKETLTNTIMRHNQIWYNEIPVSIDSVSSGTNNWFILEWDVTEIGKSALNLYRSEIAENNAISLN